MLSEILYATYLTCSEDYNQDIENLVILSKLCSKIYYLNPGNYIPNIEEMDIDNLVYLSVPFNGRDFGTWKYALQSIEVKASLVFMNNTIKINSEKKFVDCLQGLTQYDVSFVTGSQERGNHGQTYLFYINRNAVELVREFFKQYSPTLDRQLTIDKGEVRFTEFLTSSGMQPKILHKVNPVKIYFKYIFQGGIRQNLDGLFDYRKINPVYFDAVTINDKYGFSKAKR